MALSQSSYPTLYQINTRVWLNDLSKKEGKTITLDNIPEQELDKFKELGFEWIWLLSVWQTGEKGREISRTHLEWLEEFKQTLPDLKEEDIDGSGFAITAYEVHQNIGGNPALIRLRKKLKKRGIKLMLDFVPNHTAIDHKWAAMFPQFYIEGTPLDLKREPQNFILSIIDNQTRIFAHGRDPYFPGWPDTLQLNYANPELQNAMINEIEIISKLCDGIRCDMAMLVIPEVFEKTWGRKCDSFWPKAIHAIKSKFPEFKFMAEVYWDLEWELQQQGFDYTYDKRLIDRLKVGQAKPIREHFFAGLEYQSHLVRFLENHDEARAAVIFEQKRHEAAAIITYFSPGLRFFHQGQLEGKKLRISPHLVRGPEEPIDQGLQLFYSGLISLLHNKIYLKGNWSLLECKPAWMENGTWESFIAFAWETNDGKMSIAVVNYAPYSGQCFLRLPYPHLANSQWILQDLMSEASYEREGNSLFSKGLFLDMPAWHYHVFELEKLE